MVVTKRMMHTHFLSLLTSALLAAILSAIGTGALAQTVSPGDMKGQVVVRLNEGTAAFVRALVGRGLPALIG
jgi:hypothetical protein